MITKQPPIKSTISKTLNYEQTSKKVRGWTPIMYDSKGGVARGKIYSTYEGAVNEGMRTTDETKFNKFNVYTVMASPEELRNGRQFKRKYKFTKRKGTFIENRYNRFDRPMEKKGRMNILNMVLNNREKVFA